MINFTVSKKVFDFKYLPDFADFILKEKLEEFVTVGIRFCREVDLPILKPLSKFSEAELVQLSIQSNTELLDAIAHNQVADYIIAGAKKYIANEMGFLDQADLVAEDLTLGFYLRRKLFTYFLDAYTKNMVLQKFIIGELDIYTSQEELIAYSIYLKLQHDKFRETENLYKLGLGLNNIGSWVWDLASGKLQWSQQMYRIFEVEENKTVSFGEFLSMIHPSDRDAVKNVLQTVSNGSDRSEYTFTISVGNQAKTIKGISRIEVNEQKQIKRCYGTCQEIDVDA
ncbi:MAG: hypothetical protein K0Q79_2028 [Flavipsychrobacter sp.]|jgi:PAS domain-containing protein|nr:hypothetical protein [Flavipsychrobacter sp.]